MQKFKFESSNDKNVLGGLTCTVAPRHPARDSAGSHSTHPKLTNKPTKRLALQHELLAFSSSPGLRLFAAFVKLDQGFRMKLSPAWGVH